MPTFIRIILTIVALLATVPALSYVGSDEMLSMENKTMDEYYVPGCLDREIEAHANEGFRISLLGPFGCGFYDLNVQVGRKFVLKLWASFGIIVGMILMLLHMKAARRNSDRMATYAIIATLWTFAIAWQCTLVLKTALVVLSGFLAFFAFIQEAVARSKRIYHESFGSAYCYQLMMVIALILLWFT